MFFLRLRIENHQTSPLEIFGLLLAGFCQKFLPPPWNLQNFFLKRFISDPTEAIGKIFYDLGVKNRQIYFVWNLFGESAANMTFLGETFSDFVNLRLISVLLDSNALLLERAKPGVPLKGC